MRTIVFSPAARDDLVRLSEYVAERNPTAADSLLNRIETDVRRLAHMPGIGHRRRDVKDKRYRF